MKKIFALILCLMLLFAVPIAAYAEGETVTEVATSEWDTISGAIVDILRQYYKEIITTIFILCYTAWEQNRDKRLNKNVGTLNNNAITVAENSTNFMSKALSNIEDASYRVTSFEETIATLLEAYQQTAEEKKKLENELVELKEYLKTSVDANVEFADELAELLGLANIPNYKKEEIGARHVAAKKQLIERKAKAEAVALLPANTEEVKGNVGEEKEN